MVYVFSGCESFVEKNQKMAQEEMKSEKEEGEELKEAFEDEDETDFEKCFVTEYLAKFKILCENTSALHSSLLLQWIFRSILIKVG